MPEPIDLYVAQRDINQGIRADPEHCPIANALYRKTGRQPAVYSSDDIVLKNGSRTYYVGPGSIDDFIRDFDLGLPVKPIRFRLRINTEMD